MKVVLDTNVFISGIHWRGDSAKIIDAWIDDKFELISSEDVLQELAKTLLNFKKPLSQEDILHWISLIASKAIIVTPTVQFEAVKVDPDDNKFIDIAVEGNAEYIVTQDKDLLDIKEFQGIKIVKPQEFLRIFK
ncbi:MAG: putative toxin-antitoxin system toxin component, PIN family [Nanoarchaeota archaeon]